MRMPEVVGGRSEGGITQRDTSLQQELTSSVTPLTPWKGGKKQVLRKRRVFYHGRWEGA